jgi:hypothetical protein
MAEHDSFEIDMDNSSEEIKEWSGEGFGPPEVPPGEYVVDVLSVGQKTSKAKGTPMLEVEFEVAEGDFAGKKLSNNYVLTDAARGRIKKLQNACGARLDKIRSDELRGARIRVTVTHNPGNQQLGPDGNPKCDANGVPYPPRTFANVTNERALEEVKKEAPAAPPVTRGKNSAPAAPTRRA